MTYNKPNNNGYNKGSGYDKPQATIPTIILDYINNPNLFDETAKEVSLKISKTKSTQIRNFYDYVLDLNQQSKVKPFSEVLPFVKMLNSKVAYSRSRGHSTDEFVLMMQNCIKQVDSKEKLEIFKLFFEAVIGFSKK
ncbi:type III-A CRISPR-associated protein Csm2 [Aliarcobacter butzleri]|uniref:type III-A CRISPR-associated protein Csm2 n=1 Tax=Aliarcobacter butzleri TaxID=28197 RepID=UPI00125EE9BE|nr:type III-A CRISPR-associated protein Csm2 [Aliarcobacter butzleri]MCT7597230.1 type III-A CRISPR-associated protein Csm2 [Aliarcobacter butzleri]MDK2063493.1 type III-A CRISPR-associated protein Csm2 [Aliarcobacter butzleri]